MKTYHSIPKYSKDFFGKNVFGFEKIDGSNFRAEWNRKLSKKTSFTCGFAKFGTRNQGIQNTNNPFIKAIEIFKEKYVENLDKIFIENKCFRGIDKITVYSEFFGKNSFAGLHDWSENHDVKIFDIFIAKKGYLNPADFQKIFTNLDICKPMFYGIFNEHIVNVIENSETLDEGIVCKGTENKNVFMFKLKTKKWLKQVEEKFGKEVALKY